LSLVFRSFSRSSKNLASDPGYCIENGYLVRIELLEWLKQQRLSGKTPSIEDFEKQLEFMLSEYHQKYGV
jgi:hypothetical protein